MLSKEKLSTEKVALVMQVEGGIC